MHYTFSMQDQIGPYQITRELGRGGMGVVYLAIDTRLDRQVAIKSLPVEMASDLTRLERFEREAKAMASLNHSNVAGIYGVEELDGSKYLVLEYIEGETLADVLDHGPIQVDDAIELAVQIASGIEAAHEAGVIHRDLKPANIMVTTEGVVKVLDFGLAKSDEGATSSSDFAQDPTLSMGHSPTMPGVILGTAAYMSPEQARGRKVDKRTDIWSFGVLLYEMLTGANPFAGETATDSIGAVLHKDPDISRLTVSVPIGVRRVISRCLERDRNIRYRDIGDVRIELTRAATEPAEEETVTKGGLSPMLALIFALVLAVGGLAAGWLVRPIEAPREFRLSVAGPPDEVVFGPLLDPQGRYVVFGSYPPEDASRGPLANIRWLDRHESVQIEASRRARSGEISPDGEWISFAAPVDEDASEFALIKQVASLELPPVRVCILPESNAISFYRYLWMSQGQFLLDDSRTNQVRWVDAESGSIGEPIVLDLGEYQGRYLGLLARVDDHLALVILSGASDQSTHSDIGLLDMQTATVTLLIENTESASIGPDGSLLFTRGATLYGAEFDLDSRTIGPAKQLVAGLRVNANTIDSNFDVSSDGTIAFLPGGVQGSDRNIQFQSLDGELTKLGVESKPYLEHLAVSPDESRLVVIVNSPSNQLEIWGTELDSPRMRRVRGVQGSDLNYPFLGPDNDSLVYVRMNNGKAAIEVASFDGLFEPRLIVEPVEVGFVAPLAIHPSGDRVLVMWEQPEGFRIYEVMIDGSGTMKPVVNNGSNVAWSDYSPDGSMIAYTSDESGRREAYVRSIQPDGSLGRSVPVTTRGAVALQWQLDPSRRPGVLQPESDSADDPDAPFILYVYNRAELDAYPVTPGDMPRVGEPTVGVFPRNSEFIGGGASLSGDRQLRIVRGEQEKPAEHVELILNWYDEAVKIIKDE